MRWNGGKINYLVDLQLLTLLIKENIIVLFYLHMVLLFLRAKVLNLSLGEP